MQTSGLRGECARGSPHPRAKKQQAYVASNAITVSLSSEWQAWSKEAEVGGSGDTRGINLMEVLRVFGKHITKSALSRGLGYDMVKYILSHINVASESGMALLADNFLYSTIGLGAEQGMSAICRIAGRAPHDQPYEHVLGYLTCVPNMLVSGAGDNCLKRSVAKLDVPRRFVRRARRVNWADGWCVLSFYDVQVALCEFHCWGQPPKRTTANRDTP